MPHETDPVQFGNREVLKRRLRHFITVREIKLKDFHYKQIFFGEHLLSQFPDKPVAIVESEKSAIIASLYMPEFIWLGCNSKTWLKAERLQKLCGRKVILYPDADGFELWQKIAQDAPRRQGIDASTSTIIETHATAEQKADGYDLVDYLIEQAKGINRYNSFIDNYNAKLDEIRKNSSLFDTFNEMLAVRLAIMDITEE